MVSNLTWSHTIAIFGLFAVSVSYGEPVYETNGLPNDYVLQQKTVGKWTFDAEGPVGEIRTHEKGLIIFSADGSYLAQAMENKQMDRYSL